MYVITCLYKLVCIYTHIHVLLAFEFTCCQVSLKGQLFGAVGSAGQGFSNG